VNPRTERIATRACGDRARFLSSSPAWLALVLALAFGSGASAFAQSAPDPAKPNFVELSKGIVSTLDLQTAFPNPAVASGSEPWLTGDLTHALLWTAVAIGVIVIVLYLRDILPGGALARRKGWNTGEAGLAAAGASAEAQAQFNADELARLGRFVDAMHVLLLQALADMHRRLDVALADSLTSREILRRAKVSPLAKSALQDIIGAVERAYFGDHPADESDYLSCRTNFATFVGALKSEAPA
jgi:hypothetical protein